MFSIKNTLRGLFARPVAPVRPSRAPRRLRVECLEERTLLCNPGELDVTFDGDGIVTTNGVLEVANDVAIQSDGKIVAAGVAGNGWTNEDFAVARYTTAGTLDNTFGGTGFVVTAVSTNRSDSASAVAIQADGKIVAGGSVMKSSSNKDWALVRYNTNGTLDTSFGTGGKVTLSFTLGGDGSNGDAISDIVIQPDGKIIAVGGVSNWNSPTFVVARFNSNGSLDNSFGSKGRVTTDIASGVEFANAVTLQSDGKIVVAGRHASAFGQPSNFIAARYNPNGTLDTAFGAGGSVITDVSGLGSNDNAKSVAIQSDGMIVLGGDAEISGTGTVFATVRYNSSGSLDTLFGTGGVVITNVGIAESANDLVIQADGKIVLGGKEEHTPAGGILVRYNTDGTLDTSFDFDGIARVDGPEFHALAMQSDGKIVGVGLHNLVPAGGDNEFAIARFCA